jgi:uncharacterized YigZ family protein
MPLEPIGTSDTEHVVKRSRFLAAARAVTSIEEAEAFIARVRTEHPDAGHVVYAFLIGDEHSEHAGVSDAGEPKGTAGRPVMEIVRGSGIRDVIVTVVRYYGGTKLGTGGLVHAYGGVAREVLAKLPTRERIPRTDASCSVPYEILEMVRLEILQHHGTIQDEAFGTDVLISWEMPSREVRRLAERIRDLSRGGSELQTRERT